MTKVLNYYRVVLVEDHVQLRATVKTLIESLPGQKVVGEVGDGTELLEMLIYQPCEMVIMDLNMPNMNGFETLNLLLKAYPKMEVIILSMHRDPIVLKKVQASGALGYVFKEDLHTMLSEVIRDVRSGKKKI